MMKLNIFYEHIFEGAAQQGISLEKMLAMANSIGITGLECDLWRLSDRENIKSLFDNCGMKAASVYNMFDMGHCCWNENEKKVHELLETASYFGADKVLAIPGLVRRGEDENELRKRMCEQLNRMCEVAADHGITVTLEDYDDIEAPFCTSDGLLYFMENTEGLRFTFDTGNFAYCLENADEAYEKLKKYIVHVHVKDRSFDEKRKNADDSNGKADLSGRIMYPSEAGCGYIGIGELTERLLSNGYKGSFSIEHFGAADQWGYMKRSAEFLLGCER